MHHDEDEDIEGLMDWPTDASVAATSSFCAQGRAVSVGRN